MKLRSTALALAFAFTLVALDPASAKLSRRKRIDEGRVRVPSVAVSGETVHVVGIDDQLFVYYTRSTDCGLTWTEPVLMHDQRIESSRPQIAASGDQVHLVFIEDGVLYLRSDDKGGSWSPPERLDRPRSSRFARSPSIVAQEQTVFVAWNLQFPHPIDDRAVLDSVVSTDAGGTWARRRIHKARAGEETPAGPIIAISRESDSRKARFHAAWVRVRQEAGAYTGAIMYRTSRADGPGWNDAQRLSSVDVQDEFLPTAIPFGLEAEGGTVLLGFANTRYDGRRRHAFYMRSRDGGTTWSDELRLTEKRSFTCCMDSSQGALFVLGREFFARSHDFGDTWTLKRLPLHSEGAIGAGDAQSGQCSGSAHLVYSNSAPFPDRLYYRRWPDFD